MINEQNRAKQELIIHGLRVTGSFFLFDSLQQARERTEFNYKTNDKSVILQLTNDERQILDAARWAILKLMSDDSIPPKEYLTINVNLMHIFKIESKIDSDDDHCPVQRTLPTQYSTRFNDEDCWKFVRRNRSNLVKIGDECF